MKHGVRRMVSRFASLAFTLVLLLFGASPAPAQEYAALAGVKGLDTVFDFTLGSPEKALVVFPAMRGVYQDKSVTSLPNLPHAVIVFHGPAVQLLVTGRSGDADAQQAQEKFAEALRQFKKDGGKLEVCMYAVKVMGIDPATLMPEIDQVGNGFIAVAGYQAQGYSVIGVP